MVNTSQASDLEGIHHEMHGIVEQIKIMNKINARLVRHLATNNLPPPTTLAPEAAEWQARSPVVFESRSSSQNQDTTDEETRRRGRLLRRDKFKLPSQLGVYERKTDPMDHPDSFNLMLFQEYSEKVICKAFSATLKGLARSWFKKLTLRTIDSPAIRLSPRTSPKIMSTLQSKADKYIAIEELVLAIEELVDAKRVRQRREDHKRKKLETQRSDYRDEVKSKRSDKETRRVTNDQRPRTPPRQPNLILLPLNIPIAQMLMKIKNEELVKWTGKIKTDPLKRNKNKYCEFHKNHGQNIEDCFQLKEQIADRSK
ncbi:hypothetical protein Acr_18g0012100 [Actinidia rufa]|uniref:Retrotransposon gag domain-containing protein n=1 Tax=Actinidia rufa TaxID=165716 RepID=A0A7J0G8B3_9ERIC|nr:hypothetical protein Acr_18g0012100 [Actinidia rufa]